VDLISIKTFSVNCFFLIIYGVVMRTWNWSWTLHTL